MPIDAREAEMERVSRAVHRLIQATEDSVELSARRGKMHPTDFRCLAFLSEAGRPVSPKEIIAHLYLSSGSGTALLDRLEAAGFIRRVPNPADRRSVLIVLDRAAAAAPLRLVDALSARYVHGMKDFSERDLAVIAAFLEGLSSLVIQANETLHVADEKPAALVR